MNHHELVSSLIESALERSGERAATRRLLDDIEAVGITPDELANAKAKARENIERFCERLDAANPGTPRTRRPWESEHMNEDWIEKQERELERQERLRLEPPEDNGAEEVEDVEDVEPFCEFTGPGAATYTAQRGDDSEE